MPRFPSKTPNLFSIKSKFDDAVLQKRMNELQLFVRELLSFEVFAKSAILLDWLQAANEVTTRASPNRNIATDTDALLRAASIRAARRRTRCPVGVG